MHIKNSLIKIIPIALAALVIAWAVMPSASLGQYGKDDNTQKQGTTGQRGAVGSQTGMPAGMERYLVVITTENKDDCRQALQDFNASYKAMGGSGAMQRNGGAGRTDGQTNGTVNRDTSGMSRGANGSATDRGRTGTRGKTGKDQMSTWQWGCNSEDQTVYLFIDAADENAVMLEIPAEMRSEAVIVELGQYGDTKIQSKPMKNHQKRGTEKGSDGSDQGSGGGY